MSEGGIDYGGIVMTAIAAAAVVTIARCLYSVMIAIARCLYTAIAAIARCLYAAMVATARSLYDSGKLTKPEIVWVKLSVDGSHNHKEPSAGCGGVIRDERGRWLLGFAKKLDPNICDQPHKTELQAILTGLELASDMNVENLVVESDSEPAWNMVKSELRFKHHRSEYKVVQDIVRFLKDPKWQARLDYVPRTANRVANHLAKRARKLSSPHDHLSKYPVPPDYECNKLFLEDNEQGV